ncbi:hypothetical protein WDW37_21225 [Bdellovibrionota bacterium FG-1]
MSAKLRLILVSLGIIAWGMGGCATVPEPKYERYVFPKNVFIGEVSRPYTVLGPVRSKVDYATLDAVREEKDLCRNYYNKSARELLRFAKKQGADAVVDVQSVVFLEDGRRETYKTPECSDDGGEGQILTQGIAVKWKGAGAENGLWAPLVQTPSPLVVPSSGVTAILPSPSPLSVAQPEPLAQPESEPVAEPTTSISPQAPTRIEMVPLETPPQVEVPPSPLQPIATPKLPAKLKAERSVLPVERYRFGDPRAVPGFFP